jgi:hypothetical protein
MGRRLRADPEGRLADGERVRLWLLEDAPDYRTPADELAEAFERPTAFVRFEDDPAAFCWVAVNLEVEDTRVVGLFPQVSGAFAVVRELLRVCLVAAGAGYPVALDWPVWAQFEPGGGQEGVQKTRTWKLVFPGAEIGVTGAGKPYIRMERLRDAIAVVETWRS